MNEWIICSSFIVASHSGAPDEKRTLKDARMKSTFRQHLANKFTL